MISAKTFDTLNMKDTDFWRLIERGLDRVLHKLKPHHIVNMLDLFNREPFRASPEFFNKLITVMPIHIERLSDTDLITFIKICLNQDIKNERLFKYFIYPKIESRGEAFNFEHYIEILKILAELEFQDDLVFWNQHILPATFRFQYSYEQAQMLWESFVKLRVSVPNVDIGKYVLLIENIITQFDTLRNQGTDISDITLRMTRDLELIPTKTSTKIGLSKIKETERRLKDKNMLQGVLKDLGIDKIGAKKQNSVEESLNKIYDVKDWKKARYEAAQAESANTKTKQTASEVPDLGELKLDTTVAEAVVVNSDSSETEQTSKVVKTEAFDQNNQNEDEDQEGDKKVKKEKKKEKEKNKTKK